MLNYPFPDNLVASPSGSAIAWTFNERGVRNIYVAEGPEFQGAAPHALPARRWAGADEPVVFAPDGRTIVYVRGGDHGSNWSAEGNLQPNPSSSAVQPRMQVWSIAVSGAAAPKLLGEGDMPAIAPTGDRVAFVKDRRILIAPLDGSKPAEQAFFARGTSESPAWSPDGRALAFVSDRDDHSFIGIFTDASQPIRYLAASTSRDEDPLWSADGRQIAFVRQPGRGGTPRSPLVQQPQPWAIMIADPRQPASDPARSVVEERRRARRFGAANRRRRQPALGRRRPHRLPLVPGRLAASLFDRSIRVRAATPTLLTPGAFMVEHVSLTPDGRFLVYSANTGADRHDIDRRHIFKVPVDGSAPPTPLTTRHRARMEPGRDRRRPDGRVSRVDRAAAAAAGGDADRRRPAAHARGAISVPADFPSAKLITPEPVTFTSSDGLEIHAQLFKTRRRRRTPAGARVRPRRPAAADAARLALHGLLRERLRREPVPRRAAASSCCR